MRWFCVLSMYLFQVVNGRSFHLGRGRGGNLGSPDHHGELPKEQWFKQKLDHFSPSDLRTWKQRFYVNDSFYDFNDPGPVFLMIGGEGPANPKWMVGGAWIDYAEKFNALCINLEHRYYGESHPTEDLSVKNLQFLSSSQALADLASFIHAMNNKYKLHKGVKWIAFGGSYPGSLAAWLRLKYPHLVHSAVSSSGPLLAKLDFTEYFQVVIEALREKTGNYDCSNQIKQAHKEIIDLMKANPSIIEKEFKVCKPFTSASANDLNNFYSSLADDFAGLVQYNEDNRIGDDDRYKNLTINTVCSMLTAEGDRPAHKKMAAFNSMMLDKANETCLDYSYSNMIKELRNVTWGEGARQWTYQTCTEFGFYQTSSGETDYFGNSFPLDFYIQQCQDIFGKKFDEGFINRAAEWTNNYYGALDIAASRVLYVHGSVDPWHALGITEARDDASPAIYIHGTAHCANMYPPSENDLPQLKAARLKIEQQLATWIEMA